MPIQIKKQRVQTPFDPSLSVAWLRWMPLLTMLAVEIMLVPDLFAGWVIFALAAYLGILIALSYVYRSLAARITARVLLLAVPLFWAISLCIEVLQLRHLGYAALDAGSSQIWKYCLFNSCQMFLPLFMPAVAGAGFAASQGRKWDNNVMRVFTVLALVLLWLACFYFDEGQNLSLFGKLEMVFAVRASLYRVSVSLLTAATAVLSFAVFPPFAEQLRRRAQKKEAQAQ